MSYQKGGISSTSDRKNYYYRDSKCIILENDDSRPYIEFPNEKGNIQNIYILKLSFTIIISIVILFINIFVVFEFSHVHCGKTYEESYNNNEYSNNDCYIRELYSSSIKIPNDSSHFTRTMETCPLNSPLSGENKGQSKKNLNVPKNCSLLLANKDSKKSILLKPFHLLLKKAIFKMIKWIYCDETND
ncbi:hypothetical protein BCR32DRAFT_281669 [Anaeromyces robustus]|uniref:Uncharacterized protein n=1 Tax=Anaeromyces robustus TaxID=1754192 RepID=A0A1Y1X0H7_9FUNG|nr:hypothetical protein BCR32DRAFT_281669 [Anaeromyces robustus]|eukprot:ORX79118.1 hypothetical protein BCR32DRAFT_281669 [Anaeromyces robustus]